MTKPTSLSGSSNRIHVHHYSGSDEDRAARTALQTYYIRHIRRDRARFLDQISANKQSLDHYDVFILFSDEGNRFFSNPGKILTYAWQWHQYGHFIRVWKRDDGLHFRAMSFDLIFKGFSGTIAIRRRSLTREARSYVLKSLKRSLLVE